MRSEQGRHGENARGTVYFCNFFFTTCPTYIDVYARLLLYAICLETMCCVLVSVFEISGGGSEV